jgi:putative transposase
VLHTWTRALIYHPHVHYIVTGGGLSEKDEWKRSREDFLIPVRALSVIAGIAQPRNTRLLIAAGMTPSIIAAIMISSEMMTRPRPITVDRYPLWHFSRSAINLSGLWGFYDLAV